MAGTQARIYPTFSRNPRRFPLTEHLSLKEDTSEDDK